MVQNILDEMVEGNFSFLILVVGILQLLQMMKNKRNKEDKHDQDR